MSYNIKRRPFLYFALAMTFGIITAYILISAKFMFILIFFLSAMILFNIVFLIYIIFYSDRNNLKKIIILALPLAYLTGFISYSFAEYKLYSTYVKFYSESKNTYVNLEGILLKDLGNLEGDYYYIKAEKINYKDTANFKIKIPKDKFLDLEHGAVINCDLILSEPPVKLNPGGFSYKNYLQKQNIFFESWKIKNIRFIKQKISLKNLLIKIKYQIIDVIDNLFNERLSGFLKAVMLGEKADLDYETELLLKEAGASHILALSGLHAGIIILSLRFVYDKFINNKKTSLILITITALIYVLIVGASVSIIRASILTLLFLWPKIFYRDADFLNILSLTLVINLFLNPYSLFTVSLQLSYLIVLSIYLLTDFLNKIFPKIISISLAAQLGSLAVIAYYFGELSYIAIITNLWLIPLIALLLPLSFFIVLVYYIFPPAAVMLLPILEFSYQIMFKGLDFMRIIQGDMLVLAEPDIFLIILYYLVLFTIPHIYRKKIIFLKANKFKKLKIITPIVFLIISALFFLNFNSGLLEIHFLAVGQGDGISIKFPNDKNMIIDTGPPGKNGRQVEYSIISFLNYKGIKKIDYLIITHFDSDHSGGVKHLLNRKKVENILISQHKKAADIDYLEETAEKKNINLYYISEGDRLKLGQGCLDFLNPPSSKVFQDKNENSLVFNLKYGEYKFLFTGDLSKEGEARILDKHNLGKIDVLKLGHHGSITSTGARLLDECRPDFAVISVGKNNYGHPDKEVLAKLKRRDISYFRTDENGTVSIKTDGEKLQINNFID